MNSIQNLTALELQTALATDNVTLVDVREPAEFAAARIEGAVLHPLSAFNPAALPPGKVIFSCGSGKRSVMALQRSQTAGLPHDAHLAGGLLAWQQAGLPTVSGPE